MCSHLALVAQHGLVQVRHLTHSLLFEFRSLHYLVRLPRDLHLQSFGCIAIKCEKCKATCWTSFLFFKFFKSSSEEERSTPCPLTLRETFCNNNAVVSTTSDTVGISRSPALDSHLFFIQLPTPIFAISTPTKLQYMAIMKRTLNSHKYDHLFKLGKLIPSGGTDLKTNISGEPETHTSSPSFVSAQ